MTGRELERSIRRCRHDGRPLLAPRARIGHGLVLYGCAGGPVVRPAHRRVSLIVSPPARNKSLTAAVRLSQSILQEYTSQGWRATQFLLAALGALSWILTTFFMCACRASLFEHEVSADNARSRLRPETWHGPTPHALACEATGRRFVLFCFNPFRAVALLKHINILLIVSSSGWCASRRTSLTLVSRRASTRPSSS